jgi:predicted DNA-binding antitoxin AbrB/MazE fold protein
MSTATINNRKKAMAGTIRARVGRGVLKLLGKIDIPEGKEVSVTILDVPSSTDKEAFRRAAGGWKGTVDADAFLKNNAESRMRSTHPEIDKRLAKAEEDIKAGRVRGPFKTANEAVEAMRPR